MTLRLLLTLALSLCASAASALDLRGIPVPLGVTAGGTGLTTIAADQVPLGTALNTITATAIGDCDDSAGNHLNYDTTTHAFSCGTSSSSGISGLTTNTIPKATSATAIGDGPLVVNAGDVTSSLPFLAPATLDAQLYSFTGDTDTGMGRGGANNLRLYAGGVILMAANATDIYIGSSAGLNVIVENLKFEANENVILDDNGAGVLTMNPGVLAIGVDPADAGSLRLANAEKILWEASPAGTDVGLWVGTDEALYSDAIAAAATGTRYLCIDTANKITSSASACSGT